jgi:hypothetical protein
MCSIHGHGGAPSFFHMSNIGTYARVLRMEPRDLLYSATVFPSLVAFQPWERRDGYISQAIQTHPENSLRLSALQSTRTYVPYRRFCSLCVRRDKAQYGWSYWHVSHNLPGVSFCRRHDVRLRESVLLTGSGKNCWSYLLPGEVDSILPRHPRSSFELELNRIALATQCGDLWSALGPLPHWYYRRSLEQAGLIDPNRQISAPAAKKWVGDLLRTAPSCASLLTNDPKLTWVEGLLRHQDRFPFPSFKHLAVHAALSCGLIPSGGLLNHKSTGMTPRDVGELDAETAARLDLRLRQLVAEGARFTLKSLLEELGVWSKFRHTRTRFPKVKTVIERHRRALIQSRSPRGQARSQGESI